MRDQFKAARYKDFVRRAEYAPDSVYLHRSSSWQYIPVHPFADEPDVLSQLELRPEDCSSVDAWWAIDGDAALVESYTLEWGAGVRPPGLYVLRTTDDPGWLKLHVVVDCPAITRCMFEAAMSRFAELGFPRDAFYRRCPENEMIRIGALNISR